MSMKVIHTSDWHLGHRLYNYDRAEEEEDFLESLSSVVGEERPDALLVCGDIYHTGAPGNEVSRLFTERLLEMQSRCPSMEVVVIAGNHDSCSRLEIDRSLWARCHVRILGTPGENADGTADFGRNVIVLKGKGVIAAVPFCHPRNFPCFGEVCEGMEREEAYFRGLGEAVSAVNPGRLPAVLMGHLAVGKETSFTGQERANVIGGEECVEPEMLGGGYDYVALGHIHCPQWIVKDGRRCGRYCGTPRPIHFDEAHSHGVDVVEVEAGGEAVLRTVELKPLRSLRTIGGRGGLGFEAALAALEERGRSGQWQGDYLRLNVALQKNERPGSDWNERARLAAEKWGMRFCLLHFLRETEEAGSGGAELGIQEIRELKDEDVLKILRDTSGITENQVELLRGLMAEMKEGAGNHGAAQ